MLSWRTASLFWHLAVVRRVGCRLQRQAGCRVSSNRTRAGSSCLWGGYAARARLAALVAVCIGAMKERCTGGRRLSFDTRPWCDVSAAAPNAKLAAACAASALALLLAFSKEEAQHSSLLRARLAALVVVGRCPTEECCTGKRLPCLVRSCRATFELPPPTPSRLPRVQQAHRRRRSLSLGRRRSTRACRARAAPRWLWSA